MSNTIKFLDRIYNMIQLVFVLYEDTNLSFKVSFTAFYTEGSNVNAEFIAYFVTDSRDDTWTRIHSYDRK